MRVLKRPMFRKGGSTNQGIMTGLTDRKKYQEGSSVEERAERYKDLLGKPDINELLISGGLNLVGGQGTGRGTLADIATAYQKPTANLFADIKQRDMAAKTMAIKQEDAEKIALINASRKGSQSALEKLINLSLASGEFSDLPEDKRRAAAFKKYSVSTGDVTRASNPEKIMQRAQFKYPTDVYKEEKATFDVIYRDKISAEELYKGQRGGFANLTTNAGKKILKRLPPVQGDIIFNTADGKIYRYKGGEGELAPTNIGNYEDITKDYQ